LEQVPLQFVNPAWQLSWQLPPEQTWPAAQSWPQLPQLFSSV
jgi:hypothetical protein